MRLSHFACSRFLLSMFVAFAGLFAAAEVASAQTTIAGGNVINQTWTVAGSPYTVQGDVIVPAGAFLNIQAGVDVRFTASDALAANADPARVELIVRGDLNVTGSAGAPVRFRASSGTAAGTWYGIVVEATATSASVTNAIVEHAITGLRTSLAGASITDSTFQNNSQIGVRLISDNYFCRSATTTFAGRSAVRTVRRTG